MFGQAFCLKDKMPTPQMYLAAQCRRWNNYQGVQTRSGPHGLQYLNPTGLFWEDLTTTANYPGNVIASQATTYWNSDQASVLQDTAYSTRPTGYADVTPIQDLVASVGDEPYKSYAQKLVDKNNGSYQAKALIAGLQSQDSSSAGPYTLAKWSSFNEQNRSQGFLAVDFIDPSRGTPMSAYEIGIVGNKNGQYNPGAPIRDIDEPSGTWATLGPFLADVGLSVAAIAAVVVTAGLATGTLFAGSGAAAAGAGAAEGTAAAGAEVGADAAVATAATSGAAVTGTTAASTGILGTGITAGSIETAGVGLATGLVKNEIIGGLKSLIVPKSPIPMVAKAPLVTQVMPYVTAQAPVNQAQSNTTGLILAAIAAKLLLFA